MPDTRNQPGQGNQEQGGQGTETERQRSGQGGNINEPERQAVPNPRRSQEESDPSRGGTRTDRSTESDKDRQNAS